MDNYLLYVGVAMATVVLPGPAVMLTINNSIQCGLLKSFAGILGIALAILIVAIISATSLGIILASSAVAFSTIKVIGAAYLIYLGIKMLRTKARTNIQSNIQGVSFWRCFIDGFFVSISNPKAVIFFMSIFPQFIDPEKEYTAQFILLSATFSVLVLLIHALYAVFSSFVKSRLSSQKGSVALNRISGGIFVGFGVGLAATSK